MFLILKLLIVAAIHVALFVCYPDTGPRGNIFLCLSLLVWSAVMIFIGGSVGFLKLVTKGLIIVFYLAVFAAMALITAYAMSQTDKGSVLSKLKRKQFPTLETMREGAERFGVKLDKRFKKEVKAADSKLDDALDKLKGN